MSILRDGTKGHLTVLNVASESNFNTTGQKVESKVLDEKQTP